MGISKEQLDEFKIIMKKNYGKEMTDAEALESATSLLNVFKILLKGEEEEQRWKKRLTDDPRGFAMEGKGRTCYVCRQSIYDGGAWYDKYGIKCMHCQKAVEKNQIPKSIFKDRDSFYYGWQLKDKFGLHSQTVAKMVREGKIKERTIKDKDGSGVHASIYLKKENPDLR